MAARTPQRQRLIELLDPVISSAGYDLEDVTVTPAGRRSLVRVVVDRDGGVDLDAIAELSRDVSTLLDDDADTDTDTDTILNGPFVLEVSSPGVDRPVVQARQWRRATGRLVCVETASGPVTGRVELAGDDAVRLVVDGTPADYRYSELGPGRIQVEFARAGASDDAQPEAEDEEV